MLTLFVVTQSSRYQNDNGSEDIAVSVLEVELTVIIEKTPQRQAEILLNAALE